MSSGKADVDITRDDATRVTKALEVLFAKDYISKKELYKQNFIRGLFFSAGTIIGAALILGLGLWILSFFNDIPLIGPVFNNFRQTIERSQTK